VKKWIWAVSGILIVFFAVYMLRADNGQSDLGEVKSGVVKKDDLRITVGATGVVTPYIEVEVKSKAGGEIISFPFEEGDSLKKGETAVRLDPETEKSRVNQARADLLSAEAALEKARITLKDQELKLKRQKSLFDDKVVSRQDLDNAVILVEMTKSDVKIAEAGLIRAEEALKEAEDRLEDTEIKAPLSGTILKKYAEEGQVIASTTSSVSEGTLIFTMADLERIYIEALVDETDIGRVRPDQTVAVTADAYPLRTFRGNVVRIAPQGQVDSTITVFEVIIEIADSEKSMLKPMMTANAEILTRLREGVLIVPSEAVRAVEDETGVYKIVDGQLLWTPVSPGMSNGTHTEIEGEVREDEEVLLSGLKENMLPSDNNHKTGRGFRFFGRRK
jgi:HlyD family secretion protein